MLMKIIFFTEISPFPINGGERIRSYGLLKALSNLNYSVTALIQNEDRVDLDEYKMNNIEFVAFDKQRMSFFGKLFFAEFFLKDKKVISKFDELILKEVPDIAILDYNLAGRYSSYFKKKKISVIIGTHNSESNLIRQRPGGNIFKILRNFQRLVYMKIHERFYYKFARNLITVSDDDTNFHSNFFPKSKIHMIPNFLDESRYLQRFTKEGYFVVTANFEAYMNVEGLKWFVSEVWNDELDSSNRLLIVGKNSIKAFNEIKSNPNFKNITAIGMVDDITPYISKAKAVLIPLLHGSGTRLKCLEAMALETPIISTSKGVEGIESDNIKIADSSTEFRNEIMSFNAEQGVGKKLHEDFMRNYSLNSNLKRLECLIKDVND